MLLQVLLVAAASSSLTTLTPDDRYKPLTYPNDGFFTKFYSCSAASSKQIASRLKTALTAIAGQDEALYTVQRELVRFYEERMVDSKVVAPSFHLIGPSGEGKTTVAKMIAEAVSLKTEEGKPCALIQHFIPPEGEDMAGPLQMKLLNYFARSNEVGVVLIDDVSKVNKTGYDSAHKKHVINVIRRLVEHEDIQLPDGSTVSLRNAIIVLTSDFGNNAEMVNSIGLTEEEEKAERRKLVKELAKQQELVFSGDHRLATNTVKVTFNSLAYPVEFFGIIVNYLQRKSSQHGITIRYDTKLLFNFAERVLVMGGGDPKLGGGRHVEDSFIKQYLYIGIPRSRELLLKAKDDDCELHWTGEEL
eukprot:TRINITY_DN2187_c0_g1_i2.p1 TRINITY_DN2187_c0_g1~~TRINITY_DN2187_c0_g1_i2.p1  ORF type:complete len:360 (+),score=101.97 TRINITY_DN2187_c0_g1_i2:94-1173(+)